MQQLPGLSGKGSLSFTQKLMACSKLFCSCLLLLKLSFLATVAHSEALLQILPTRVIMEGNDRSATLTLVNQGNEDSAYRMFFRNIRMSDHGEFQILTDSDDVSEELFADSMLRFSPRRITIEGASKQTIRIVARKPKDLAPGEYRSHMVFRRLPNQQSILDSQASDNLTLSIQPIVEVTIPVIVRHGELTASIELSNAELVQSETETLLRVSINREGNRSLYGNLNVEAVTAEGSRLPVAEARGISVYYPNKKRIFEIPLLSTLHSSEEAVDQRRKLLDSASALSISFTENATYGGKERHAIELSL